MISGSGGSGGGKGSNKRQSQLASSASSAPSQPQQYIPTETTNNLFSTSYAKIIDLLGEGEIAGVPKGLQSIFLDNTPIENPDGSLNFKGVTVDIKNGTQSQDYIPGFNEVVTETSVGVVVTASTPVVRTITAITDAARVVVSLPALQEYTDKGDILGTSVNLRIAVQYNGGGYTTVVDDVISGRTSQQYQRQYLFGLTGPFPADIRVSRVTPDSTSSKLSNAFNWSSFSAVTYVKLMYPNTAIAGLRIDAEQFNSIPSRSYRVRGLKVRIPSNALVDNNTGRIYAFNGVWDGTFGSAQYTSDPAWCLWDLLTSNRYGFGDHLDVSTLDKWAFYSASQYASALVPNGFGGTEARFSCNANIQTADDAYRLINDLCSTLRVMPYWSSGALTISQDRPSDPAYLFTLANVGPEGFTYSGTSVKARPTVAVVKYQDLDLRNTAYEVVEDAAEIARYGVIKVEIDAFACTSRGQAQRLGRWLLYSEREEGEAISFTSNLAAGIAVRPGQVIEVADPMRAGPRRGGAVAAATTTAITLDDATGISTANSPTLSVILSDGTVQARAVSAINGNVVTVSTAFSSAPQANSIWIFESSNIQASTWRVLAVEERDGIGYAISAISYNSSKYNFIEQGLALEYRDVTDLNINPNAPENLSGQQVLYSDGSRALVKLQFSWSLVPGVSIYRVSYRHVDDNWQQVTISGPSVEILDAKEGVYEVLVASVRNGILFSQPAQLWFTCTGKTDPPSSVTGASLLPIDEASAILTWNQAPDLDVRLGGRVLIRHSPRLDTPTWGEAISIIQAASGSQVQKQVPLLSGTYLLKFEDDGGRESAEVAYAVSTLPQPQPRLLLNTYREELGSPPFNGNAIDMFYSSYYGGLVLGSGSLISSYASIAALPSIVAGDTSLTLPVVPKGEYEFGSTYDLGGVFDVNIQRRFVTRGLNQLDLLSARPGLVSEWTSIAGLSASDVDAALLVRSTPTDPDTAPQWSEWNELANGIVRGRAFQFKTIASSYDFAQNILIEELGATMELQQRIEQSGTLPGAESTRAVTFQERFYEAPSVGITAYGMSAGDYMVLEAATITRAGFSVTFRNSAGVPVARQFNYTAIGFGREVN